VTFFFAGVVRSGGKDYLFTLRALSHPFSFSLIFSRMEIGFVCCDIRVLSLRISNQSVPQGNNFVSGCSLNHGAPRS